jgi:hypothetical protein
VQREVTVKKLKEAVISTEVAQFYRATQWRDPRICLCCCLFYLSFELGGAAKASNLTGTRALDTTAIINTAINQSGFGRTATFNSAVFDSKSKAKVFDS